MRIVAISFIDYFIFVILMLVLAALALQFLTLSLLVYLLVVLVLFLQIKRLLNALLRKKSIKNPLLF